ncbi:twin-arginine translocase subunit TatC [Actinopolyspora mortivallis]|uniref:Sec-independent protein translocase protein TatC n=1 Tax=Actinopolyspora mortivallis TaxID=33906 RepID=A0A2T0H1U0_ACTMO|nr:twin-arginine translocase subunit TatC [Actinopolyspora mortivallis]PRW65312.1 twin-arginine translocase subunit TatC [Actinopolyspora mortivallis]
MSLVEHLYELRYRLGVALLAVVIGGIFGFWWFSHRLFGLPSLGDLMTGPYCALPDTMRLEPNGECQLMQTRPFEVFLLQLKVGFSLGAVLLSPVWLYQFWAFIAPGLHKGERVFARVFVGIGSVLFAVGAVLAYFVVPKGLTFMAGFGGDQFFTALTGGEYINFVLLMLLFFGISFELPLVMVMLNRADVVSYAKLRSWWRGSVFALFIFAAVVTPQDPISMLVLGLSLCVLYGIALLICRAQDRSKERRRAAEQTEDPDQPSEVDTRPSALHTTGGSAGGDDEAT